MQVPQLDFTATTGAAIRRAAEKWPDREMIVTPEFRMTFAQAEAASRRVAKQLLAKGVGKGTRVAIEFGYGPDWAIAYLAITRIGALCLPLSTAYRPAELCKVLVHGDVDTLLVPTRYGGRAHASYLAEALPSLADASSTNLRLREAPYLRRIVFSGDAPVWGERLDLSHTGTEADPPGIDDDFLAAIETQVVPADLAVVIHTSGTTGDQKGVMHTHGAFIRHSANLAAFHGYTEESSQLSALPWFWIGGLVLSFGESLTTGFTIVCIEKWDDAAALRLALRERPRFLSAWPQLAARFHRYVAQSGVDVSDVPALAPRPGGPVDPGLLHGGLGMTETLGNYAAPGPELGKVLDERRRGSFGLLVPHTEVRVVDPETGAEVAPGEQGEIVVRGYSLAHGLYKKERHTVFDDDGWLHTGDLGSIRHGCVFFAGRRSGMIKTNGSNVAPAEVEAVLKSAPGVDFAVVFGVDDAERGQAVAAVVSPKPGVELDPDELRAYAAEWLSSYKVPRILEVRQETDLPFLPNGKINLRDLTARLENVTANRD